MIRFCAILLLVVASDIVLTAPAFGETASELLVSARESLTAATLADLPAERLRNLKTARMWIERLLDEHPDAIPSGRLLAGEAVAGMQRERITEEIKKLERELGPCIPRPTRNCLFNLAIEVAREVQDLSYRGPALASVSSTLARAGDIKRSEALLNEAITVVSETAEKAAFDDVHSLAAWVKADLGKFDEALAQVDQTQNAVARGLALNDIVKAHLSRNNLPAAKSALRLAEDNLSESGDDVQPIVQALLAESYARAGDQESAIIYAYEAAANAANITSRDLRDTALVFAIRALAHADELEWASYLADNEVSDAAFRCVSYAFLAEYKAEFAQTDAVVSFVELAQETCPRPEEIDDITGYAAVSISRAFALVGKFDIALEILRLLPSPSIAQAWGYGEVSLLLPK